MLYGGRGVNHAILALNWHYKHIFECFLSVLNTWVAYFRISGILSRECHCSIIITVLNMQADELVRFSRGMQTSCCGPDFIIVAQMVPEELDTTMKIFQDGDFKCQRAYWVNKPPTPGMVNHLYACSYFSTDLQ